MARGCPSGYGVRVDQGHILQRVELDAPLPKAPEKEDLTLTKNEITQ